jgi:peptidoglycan/xylan/chitin deacetylase (PgdA/CDA1 family)
MSAGPGVEDPGMRFPRPAPWLSLLLALIVLAGISALVVHAGREGGGGPPAPGTRASARTPAPARPESGAGRTRRRMAELSLRREPLYRGSEHRPLVALTFDDGPGRDTMRVLSALNRLRVRATFFVIGRQLAGRERELRAIVAHGDALGVHSWSHPDLTTLPPARVRAELLGTRNAIRRITGGDPVLYRPPYGAVDATVMASVAGARMVPVLWDVDGADWAEGATPKTLRRTVLAEVRPGSIILLHDGGGRRGVTARALPAIVAGLRARGLRPVLVTELLERDPPPSQAPAPPARPGSDPGR